MTIAFFNLTDDSIRLTLDGKPDAELLKRLRDANYRWWPGRKLNVAKWSVTAEDLAIELAELDGLEVKEEQDDPEERAERFSEYAEHAKERAEQLHESVAAIADNIPLGQPILIGHHSERHARKDAERIENGMRKTIEELNKADYWAERAKSTVRHANYKQQPGVIKRRIDKIEALLRKYQRDGKFYQDDAARAARAFMYDILKKPYDAKFNDMTPEEKAQTTEAVKAKNAEHKSYYQRCIEHTEMVLQYQKALYAESGGVLADTVEMKAGQYALVRRGWYKILKVNRKTVELKSIMGAQYFGIKYDKTEVKQVVSEAEYLAGDYGMPNRYNPTEPSDNHKLADELKQKADALAAAPVVQVKSLFPTPPALVRKMLNIAEIREGMRLLEPSAGTGNITSQLIKFLDTSMDWCEIDYNCRHMLETQGLSATQGYGPAVADDFMTYNPGPVYDRVIMNPPFENGQDIEHVRHAFDCLKVGGRIVAVMSEGPFGNSTKKAVEFRAWLESVGGRSEKNPPGTFTDSGTNVNTRLVVINK